MKTITEKSKTKFANILFNLLYELGYKNIKEFQKSNNLIVDGYFGMKSYNVLYRKILNVKYLNFTDYYKSNYSKKQIVWHHSAGWENARGMYSSWQKDNRGRVATAIGITDDGTIYNGFDESYWASALGVKSSVFKEYGIKYIMKKKNSGKWYVANNQLLDQGAVQVEICSAGGLMEKGDNIVSWFKWKVPEEKVLELSYKNYDYYEKYTDEEVDSLKYWTLLQAIRFDIPLDYNHDDMWDVSKKALNGEKGVFTHNSYRKDKTDVSPQPHLIEMAKSLTDYTL